MVQAIFRGSLRYRKIAVPIWHRTRYQPKSMARNPYLGKFQHQANGRWPFKGRYVRRRRSSFFVHFAARSPDTYIHRNDLVVFSPFFMREYTLLAFELRTVSGRSFCILVCSVDKPGEVPSRRQTQKDGGSFKILLFHSVALNICASHIFIPPTRGYHDTVHMVHVNLECITDNINYDTDCTLLALLSAYKTFGSPAI